MSSSNPDTMSRLHPIWDRLRPLGFTLSGISPEHLGVERYGLDGHIRQTIQVIHQQRQKWSVHMSVGVDVLERLREGPIERAGTYPLMARCIDRFGRPEEPGAAFEGYQGWTLDELSAVADVAVIAAVPYLDRWRDLRTIIQYVLDDIERILAQQPMLEVAPAKQASLWTRWLQHRPLKPEFAPKVPPMYDMILANLYVALGEQKAAIPYLEAVIRRYPKWDWYSAALQHAVGSNAEPHEKR